MRTASARSTATAQQFSFSRPAAIASWRTADRRAASPKRYGHNPNVIGWQIDNEIRQCRRSTPRRKRQFHAWLQEPVRQRLPASTGYWTTAYWSRDLRQLRSDPDAVAATRIPALLLDFEAFRDRHLGELRRRTRSTPSARTPIRGSSSPPTRWAGSIRFDHYIVYSELDIASWDDYVARPVYNLAGSMRRHARSRSRLQTQELLGDGDAAGLRELEPDTNNPLRSQARCARWPGRPWVTEPMRCCTGSGERRSMARSNITARSSAAMECLCPPMP